MEVIWVTNFPHVGVWVSESGWQPALLEIIFSPSAWQPAPLPKPSVKSRGNLRRKGSLLESQHQDAIKLAEQTQGCGDSNSVRGRIRFHHHPPDR